MPAHAAEYIKKLLNQSNPRISVQKMCDDTNLPKSTIDKYLAGQTTDTGWNNVVTMVKYLGGSLDELAQIQVNAVESSTPPPVAAPSAESHRTAEHQALALLVKSYVEEIERINRTHDSILSRFKTRIDDERAALVDQHKAACVHIRELCDGAMREQGRHLEAAIKGRDFWRTLSCVLIGVLVLAIIYFIWEFSNFDQGLTGHFLRMLTLSLAGGTV